MVARWTIKGRATKIMYQDDNATEDDEEGEWSYDVVFGNLQINGDEGNTRYKTMIENQTRVPSAGITQGASCLVQNNDYGYSATQPAAKKQKTVNIRRSTRQQKTPTPEPPTKLPLNGNSPKRFPQQNREAISLSRHEFQITTISKSHLLSKTLTRNNLR